MYEFRVIVGAMETTQPTPAPQLQLEQGQKLAHFTTRGWQVGTTLEVVRFTPSGLAHCQARNLHGGCWAVKLKPLGKVSPGDSTPAWYEPGTYGGNWYKRLTPELEAQAALSLKRSDLDKAMKVLSSYSHKLEEAQLDSLLAQLGALLDTITVEPEIF